MKECVKKEDGSLQFTMTIKSVPVPHSVKWNIKEKNTDTFEPINVNAAEYIGTSNTFPHPLLVIKHKEKLDNCIFEIEVKNRIGEVKRMISGNTFFFLKNIRFIIVYIFTVPQVPYCYCYIVLKIGNFREDTCLQRQSLFA